MLNKTNKSLQFLLVLLLLGGAAFFNRASATHIVGSDITYTCTGVAGQWKINFIIYRDCGTGPGTTADICTGNFGTPCPYAVTISGADPSCNGASLGTLTVNLVSVSDVGYNALCPTSKNHCTNMNQVAPGNYPISIEKYVFEGIIDLGPTSGIPSNCCNIRVSYYNCCRNNAIGSGAASQGFYTEAIINRCLGLQGAGGCNSSPDLTNEPFAVMCAGQPYVYNNGALDPDHDSISYSFAPSLQNPGQPVTYTAPLAYDEPMPYIYPKNAPFPAGMRCDALSGDIAFTPNVGSGGGFVGVMAIEMKQWVYVGGVPQLVGVTRRDIQMYIISCLPNNPPKLMTNPPDPTIPNQPKLNWQVCAGSTLCFDIIAKDTDFTPASIPPRSDTTYLSWNNALASKGATFKPKYIFANRHKPAPLGGPREDIYQFCWTPTEAMASTLPYYFTVNAQDDRCPNPGRASRAFSVLVLGRADVTIKKTDSLCGKWGVTYIKNKPSQTFVSTIWNISLDSNDKSFIHSNTYVNTQTIPTQSFPVGGKYYIELVVNTQGPVGEPPCSRTFLDSLIVIAPVRPIVRDSFACKGSPVTIPYYSTGGNGPYTYRWYNYPLNFPIFVSPINPSSNFNSSYYIFTPTSRTRYVLQARDQNGCLGYDDSVIVNVNSLPVFLPLDTARICYGTSYTMDFGNDNNKALHYLWNTGLPEDTLRTLTKSDSNSFILEIMDSFYCKNQDTFRLYVNAPIIPNASKDTAICKGDTATLYASGGYLYQWRDLTTGNIIQTKRYSSVIKVKPTVTTFYEVRAFVNYPDTSFSSSFISCSNTDTVKVTVNPLPVLTRPQIIQACKSASIVNMGAFFTNQPGGTGIWSYPQAPYGVSVLTGGVTQVRLDSLKNIPNDTLNYTAGLDNWIRYKYIAPTLGGVAGCTNYDSAIVRVFGVPYVTPGFDVKWCFNAGVFRLQYDVSRPAPYNAWSPSPTDPSNLGNGEEWSGQIPASVKKIVIGASTRYEFDPKLAIVGPNTLTYKYTKQYPGSGAPSCQGDTTVIFNVVNVPIVIAGNIVPVCSNDPIFNLTSKAGTTSTPQTNAGFWTYAPITPKNGIDVALKDSQNFDPGKVTMAAAASQASWKLYYNDISTGCAVKDSLNITVAKFPTVDLILNPTDALVCLKSGTKTLSTNVSPAGGTHTYTSIPVTTAYQAKSGDPSKSLFNTDDPSLTAGTYSLLYMYSVKVPSSTVQCSNYDTVVVKVQAPPAIQISTRSLQGCVIDSSYQLGLGTDPSPAYKFRWMHTNGGGHFVNGNDSIPNPVYLRDSATDVTLGKVHIKIATIKLNSNDPCPIAEDSVDIIINPQPLASITCQNCNGCETLTPVLTAGLPGTPVSYEWSIDGVVQSSNTDIFTKSFSKWGQYKAQLKVSTPANCTTISAPQYINVYSRPFPRFTPDPPFTTVARPFFDFIDKSESPDGSALTYLWTFGPSTPGGPERTSTEQNPRGIGYAADTSNRPVKLVVTSTHGCSDSAFGLVRIDPDITVFIPNAFYPGSQVQCGNDPTCNKTFKVAANGYMTIEIFIFNRWGQQVFHTTDINAGWNGNMNNNENGGECQQDVYIYQINATSFSGKAYKYSGSVTLLR